MEDKKPGSFDIEWSGGRARVKRYFDVPHTGSIELDFRIKTAAGMDVSITELHQASTVAAIRYLLTLLPKDHPDAPFLPGSPE